MGITDAASGKWDLIFSHYKIPITSGNKHYKGPCPLCKKEGKFRLFKDWMHNGGYICVCSGGKGVALLMNLTSKSFKEIAKELSTLLGLDDDKTYKPKERDIMKDLEILRKFQALIDIECSPAEKYLRSRGIHIMPFKNVKFSPMEYYDKWNKFDAMYAVATNDDHEILYGHATFMINGVKVNKEPAKKMFKLAEGFDKNMSIKMFPVRDVMGVAEGIETGLSCAQMYDVPVWSTMNSNFMKEFKVPKGIKHLFIYADNDNNGTGLEAAFKCGRTNILMPNDVTIVDILWPRERGDFNDVLTKKISNDIIQWRLDKL